MCVMNVCNKRSECLLWMCVTSYTYEYVLHMSSECVLPMCVMKVCYACVKSTCRMYVYVHVCVCMCMYVYVYVCVCMCMCVCVYVCVCMCIIWLCLTWDELFHIKMYGTHEYECVVIPVIWVMSHMRIIVSDTCVRHDYFCRMSHVTHNNESCHT